MNFKIVLLKRLIGGLVVGFATLTLIAGCTGATEDDSGGGGGGGGSTGSAACLTEFASFVSNNINSSSVIAAQGGALYDKWWAAAGVSIGPTTDHPLWSTQTTNTRSGEDTWRCKECHGWDYKGRDGAYGPSSSHYTNFPGIWDARNDTPINVFCAIHSGTGIDSAHQFNETNTNGALSNLSILQLTKFITISQSESATEPTPKGLVDTSSVINALDASVGNASNGQTLFESTGIGCAAANCHGTDGAAQHEPIGTLSNENPYEVLHKIRYGHPGTPVMPAFSDTRFPNALTLSESADIIAYAQQVLPDPGAGGGTTPPVGDLAMIAMGGQLYDHWIEEKNAAVPPLDNPLWALQSTNTRTGADTWRCKECHGWDYKGADGAYGPSSSHYTGFGGIFTAAMDPQTTEADLVTFLTDGFFQPQTQTTVHNFAGLLTASEIQALAKFIKMGVIDTDGYIKATGLILGSSTEFANGEDLYSTKPFGTANGNCALCHGADGKGQPPAIVGEVAVNNPWEALHKVRFGQPNSQMPALVEAVIPGTTTPAFDVQDAVDIVFYSQSLPQQ